MKDLEILAMENAAMERWCQGDPMGWAEISSEDVTYFDPGLTKPIVGLQDYTEFLERSKGPSITRSLNLSIPGWSSMAIRLF